MEQEIREIIRRELPRLLTEDPELHNWVWTIVHEHSFSRAETESRFDRVLDEMRQSREEWMRRWEENEQQQIAARVQQWRRLTARSDGPLGGKQQIQLQRIRASKGLQRVHRRIDQTIGALGARWGMMSENAFRNALRGILEENFGVKVERVRYKDESGEVFGRPDQVELDVVIYDGQMLVCEIKSSASRADVYAFERKVRSYEKRVGRKADRAILISPMIEDAELARRLGIEVYTSADDVRPAR
jgi:hypothetical protein